MSTVVVYNLNQFSEGIYLPDALLVTADRDGRLTHIKQRATPQTVAALDFPKDPLRDKLLRIVEDLQPKALEDKYNAGRKKPLSLAQLLETDDIKSVILNAVHRKMDEWLGLIVQHRLPLTKDVDRRGLVKDFLLELSDEELQPFLLFQRTETSIRYRLEFVGEQGRFNANARNIEPITNHPAWVTVDWRLCRIAHLNGNLVKPFQKKEVVVIPRPSVKTYFERFILKIAEKVDIEAQGFEVVQHTELQGCHIEPVQNVFGGDWVLKVEMVYSRAVFLWSHKKQSKTALEFKGEEDIRVITVRRDQAAEAAFIEKLRGFGLENASGSAFQLTEKAPTVDPYHLLGWLGQQRRELEAAGFTLTLPKVEDKTIALSAATVELRTESRNDWFDIHGMVRVGELEVPFLAIARYIREQNRFFPLPDGNFFLIPAEWMARYQHLSQFAKKDGEGLRLAKSQYTLLSDLEFLEPPKTLVDAQAPEDFRISPLLRAELRPYQTDGVRWLVQLYHNGLGACLADDMGLGKTLQTIALLLYAKAEKPKTETVQASQLNLFQPASDTGFLNPLHALIVLPASLVFNWRQELAKFAPSLTVYEHTGPKRHKDIRLISRFDVVLTTYQTALKDLELLRQIEYTYVVLDESQYIKNRESKVFKALNNLESEHRLSLSGTPIENSLSDLWSQMEFANPGLLGSYGFFQRSFITPIEKGQDEVQKELLRTMVQPYLLRRTKEAVAQDLPPLSTQLFYTEMTEAQRKLYEKEKSAARNFLLENFQPGNEQYRIMVLQALTKLRQMVNHPRLVLPDYDDDSGKFRDVLERLEEVRKGGHKVLVFSSFVQYLQLFRAELEAANYPFAWLTGEQSSREREAAVKQFQTDPATQFFLLSIKAGGAGLNLTAADYVFILDPWWNPATESQAIARAHRIGQDKNVFALKFITRNSIEEKILKLQERKAQLAEDIVENAGRVAFSRSDLEALLA
ncbi:MAG: DEAD/DEAH box helicase [Saprospiraceae bacterium]